MDLQKRFRVHSERKASLFFFFFFLKHDIYTPLPGDSMGEEERGYASWIMTMHKVLQNEQLFFCSIGGSSTPSPGYRGFRAEDWYRTYCVLRSLSRKSHQKKEASFNDMRTHSNTRQASFLFVFCLVLDYTSGHWRQ